MKKTKLNIVVIISVIVLLTCLIVTKELITRNRNSANISTNIPEQSISNLYLKYKKNAKKNISKH